MVSAPSVSSSITARLEVLARPTAVSELTTAIERGELPPVDSSFLSEVLAGPVQLFVTRRSRAFTRADAARVTGVVLAGIRATHSA